MAWEKRRSEAFVKEVMNAFHMDESDATVVALSMLIRELVLAAQVAEAVA
jgi:hypothetical protein